MKLTLNQTWKECLRMWKWIDGEIKKDNTQCVAALKWAWLGNNGYEPEKVEATCFFCDWCVQNGGGCSSALCPGKQVSKRIGCDNSANGYDTKPRKFYKKLLQLNAKRKSKG